MLHLPKVSMFFLFGMTLLLFDGSVHAQQLRALTDSNQEQIARAEELANHYINTNDLPSAIVHLNQISQIYLGNGRPDKAAESFMRTALYYEKINDFRNMHKILSNTGLIYLDIEDVTMAERAFTQSLAATRRTNDTRLISTALVDLAYVKGLRNDQREAIKLLEESLSLALQNNYETMLPNIYQQLARNYTSIGNIRQGEEFRRKYSDTRDHLARQSMLGEFQQRDQKSQIEIHRSQAEARAQEALMILNKMKFQQEQDSIYKIVQAAEDSLVQARQLDSLHRQSILLLESDAQLQMAELERQKAYQNYQRTIIYSGTGGLILFFFLIIIMFKSNKSKQKANRQLAEKNEEIQTTSEQLQSAFKKIEDQNHRITQSISYAKEIQKALFPPAHTLTDFLPDSFIFFKPVNIVSGDFYWFREVQMHRQKIRKAVLADGQDHDLNFQPSPEYYNFDSDKFIVSAVDCTGHGVPGAFMSMIGYNLLDSITESGTTNPDKILNRLHNGVRQTLKQDEGNNRDGMDISICSIDKRKRTIEFAGANNPLVYIQDDEVFVIKGDRYSIGGMQKEEERKFTSHSLQIDKPTCFYIFSDGYTDQFGGDKGRSLLLKNFKNLLLQIHKQPMKMQKQLLEEHFKNWRGKEDQIDDVVVIGFRLG
jgi:serine phosphatase RsbU (regulator of sigma subunit)